MTATEELDAVGRILAAFPGAEIDKGDLGAHALELAAAGWEVFPLAPATKRPLLRHACLPGCRGECGGTGHGYLDATTDPATIARWWGEHPHALIAARVPAGLVLLDSDPRHSDGADALAALADELGQLPATLTVESGRGDGGLHRYYRRPPGALSSRRLPRGVDLKHHGCGYAVMPPSPHPATGAPYVWGDRTEPVALLPWLAGLLRPPPRPARNPVADWLGAMRGRSTEWRLAALCRTVAGAAEGNRNKALHWAACRGADMILDGADRDTVAGQLLDAARRCGLDDAEAEATVDSGLDGPVRA